MCPPMIFDFISICGEYHHDNYHACLYTGGGWESSLIFNVHSYGLISDHEIGLAILYSFIMLHVA